MPEFKGEDLKMPHVTEEAIRADILTKMPDTHTQSTPEQPGHEQPGQFYSPGGSIRGGGMINMGPNYGPGGAYMRPAGVNITYNTSHGGGEAGHHYGPSHGQVIANQYGRGVSVSQGAFYDSNGRIMGYHGSGQEDGAHFLGISPQDNLVLQTHPDFLIKNPLDLNGPQLVDAYHAYHENISHLFPGAREGAWHSVQVQRADKLLSHVDPTGHDQFSAFIHKLYEMTNHKVKPQGGLFHRHETIGHWIARATQFAAKNGRAEDVGKLWNPSVYIKKE
jgi:hypothetical protein